ncbi:hypothetical protein FHS42_003471 [Streptomyces zagrosensis]|uniref:Uncharacterized protein n=1 Tax=Streptomyces zagrosensis TaxID=1042984 RepID=A0A7W9QA62_9ACTN|nr:hypothetical protein [Streptomyces zagrosensis]
MRRDNSAARDAVTKRMKISAIVGGVLAVATAGIALLPLAAVLIAQYRHRAKLRDQPDLPALYGLIVHTAGTQRDTVWSTAKHEIDQLVQEIAGAIDKAGTTQLTYDVRHAVAGDLIQQYGANRVSRGTTSTD